jgi:hypothetical protein
LKIYSHGYFGGLWFFFIIGLSDIFLCRRSSQTIICVGFDVKCNCFFPSSLGRNLTHFLEPLNRRLLWSHWYPGPWPLGVFFSPLLVSRSQHSSMSFDDGSCGLHRLCQRGGAQLLLEPSYHGGQRGLRVKLVDAISSSAWRCDDDDFILFSYPKGGDVFTSPLWLKRRHEMVILARDWSISKFRECGLCVHI